MQPIYVLPDAFTREQAARFRGLADEAGFCATGGAYPPSYRNNDRVVLDDGALGEELFATIRDHIPNTVTVDDGSSWHLIGLNERFRFCRYRDGQKFGIHRDGVFHRDHRTRSVLTFMIYLNDAAEFDGGHTRFYNSADPAAGLLMSMAPRCGTLIVFDHALWHDGAPVTGGTKYVMRSDVVYERIGPSRVAADGHLGYVWDLAALRDGRVASAGRDGTVRLWTRAGDGLRADSMLANHGGSVSAITTDRDGALWTGSRRGALRVFEGDRLVATHDAGADAILSLAPLAGNTVAVSTARGTIETWSREGRVSAFDAHAGWVWDILALPCGDLVSAGEDGRVRRWRADGQRAATLCDAGAPVRCLALLEGNTIAAGCSDGTLLLLPPAGPAMTITAHAGAVRAIAQSADGVLMTAGEDARVHGWRLPELAWVHTESHDDFVTSLLPMADGHVISAGYDGRLRVWPAAGAHGQVASSTNRPALVPYPSTTMQ